MPASDGLPITDAAHAIRNEDADAISMDVAAGEAADKARDADEATDEDAHADGAIPNEDADGIPMDVAAGEAAHEATYADEATDEATKAINNAKRIALHDRISAEIPRPYPQLFRRL